MGDHLARPVYHPSLAIQPVLNVYQSPLSIQPNSRCLSSSEPIAGKGSKCLSSFRPVPTRLKCARRVSPGSTPCHTSVYRHDKSRSHHRPPFHIEQNPSTLRYYTLFCSEQNPPLLPSYTLSRTSLCRAEEALVCRQGSPLAFLWKTIALHPPLLFPLEEAHSLANNAHQSWSPQVSRIRIGYSPGERLREASSTRLISMYMSPPASAPPLLHCP